MKILDHHIDLNAFWQQLTRSSRRMLILDYDGTLAPFRKDRSHAIPYEGVTRILDHIISCPANRVIMVTGRSIHDIVPLLDLKTLPEIWGVHGRERQTRHGEYSIRPVDREARECIDNIYLWAGETGIGKSFEKKPGSLALHTRDLEPELAQSRTKLVKEVWDKEAMNNGLKSHVFDGGLEYRAGHCHKGQAVDTIMKEAGPGAVAAYLGDDLTDEDAFRAIRRYNGLGVLVRREFHPTEAGIWISPPNELIEFLEKWEKVCSGHGQRHEEA